MKHTKDSTTSGYSPEEEASILELLGALRRSAVQDFMREHSLTGVSATKEALVQSVREAITERKLTFRQVLRYVDLHAPWGKQHVFLYQGSGDVRNWRRRDWVERHLDAPSTRALLTRTKELVLPDRLTLTAIDHTDERLTVAAIQKRPYIDRLTSQDFEKTDDEGRELEFHAYVRQVTRVIVRFEWNLAANNAMLQITQLGKGSDYDTMRDAFAALVAPWLTLTSFSPIDLRRGITTLHRRFYAGDKETRIEMASYADPQGNRLEGISSNAQSSVSANGFVGRGMRGANRHGIGRYGNVYWADSTTYPDKGRNPLEQEVHVHILAADNRINITRPHTEETVRHVIGRIRAACA